MIIFSIMNDNKLMDIYPNNLLEIFGMETLGGYQILYTNLDLTISFFLSKHIENKKI